MSINPTFADYLSIVNIFGVVALWVLAQQQKALMLQLRLEMRDTRDEILARVESQYVRKSECELHEGTAADKAEELARRLERIEVVLSRAFGGNPQYGEHQR